MSYLKSGRAIGICAALMLSAAPAFAEEEAPVDEGFPGELSANVALTSTYLYRGISQSDSDPAIQGGFDWSYDIFYMGTWGSSLDFAPLELDLYAGIAPEFNGVSFDLGFIYYMYPGADDDTAEFDFWEVYGGMSYDFGPFEAGASVAYSPDFFAESGDAFFTEGTVAVPLIGDLGIDGSFGYQWIDDEAAFGTPDYAVWSIGLTYSYDILDFDLRYVDTDMDEADCFGGDNLCEARAVFTISSSL